MWWPLEQWFHWWCDVQSARHIASLRFSALDVVNHLSEIKKSFSLRFDEISFVVFVTHLPTNGRSRTCRRCWCTGFLCLLLEHPERTRHWAWTSWQSEIEADYHHSRLKLWLPSTTKRYSSSAEACRLEEQAGFRDSLLFTHALFVPQSLAL